MDTEKNDTEEDKEPHETISLTFCNGKYIRQKINP